MLRQGASALKTSELIAILLRTGTKGVSVIQVAETMLQRFGSLETLSRAEVADLAKVKGIGKAKAIELKAAFTLGARLSTSMAESRAIDTPDDVYALIGEEMRLLSYESLRVILLNTKQKILGIEEVTRGTINESIFHPREVLRSAVTRLAFGFVLVHNHPSGDPTPSTADKKVTQQLKQASDLMGIRFLDHIIIGAPRSENSKPYYSFRQFGLL
ncbi:MAG TPA: DNA repair protein RadC [Candidatus Methylacidiphilales bacterium]|nr:DNA repair protein RadC [Candidatus Methylacidiphilales bacterium]